MVPIPEKYGEIIEKNSDLILATIGPTHEPQVSTQLFLYENNQIMFSIAGSRPQVQNMFNNPRVTVFIIDPDNQRHTLEIRGTVRLDMDPDYLFGQHLGDKYGYDLRDLDGPMDTRYKVTLNAEEFNEVQ